VALTPGTVAGQASEYFAPIRRITRITGPACHAGHACSLGHGAARQRGGGRHRLR
jgi:hypothetical protein